MKLSPTQTRIWRAIGHLEARDRKPPQWRYVMRFLGYATPGSMGLYVEQMRYYGLLQPGDGYRHRALRIASGVTVLSDGSVLHGPYDPFEDARC